MATAPTQQQPTTNLLTLGPVLFGPKEGVIDYLKGKKLLTNCITCNGCGMPMQWKKKSDIKDGYTWRCYMCDRRQSIRYGSFFSRSKLELATYLNVIYHWATDQPVHTTVSQLQLSQKTVVDLFHFLREVCSKKLCDLDTRLGGPGCVVEIDESLFRAKRKYNRGRAVRVSQQVWVLGMVDISHSRRVGIMEIVDSRDAATLLPVIRRHVKPGTIIHTDQWAAYSQLQHMGFQHQTVNHSVNFVDPTTRVHTQNIESYWGRKKMKLKRMRGTTRDMLPGYLDEEMWRDRFGQNGEAYDHIIEHIAEQYQVN